MEAGWTSVQGSFELEAEMHRPAGVAGFTAVAQQAG
jgi:hypothetical protein